MTPPSLPASLPGDWPPDVRPPESPDWERSAVAWLFDLCPPDYRAHDVLRRHPVVLAWLAALSVAAATESVRTGVRRARADLRDVAPPEVVEATIAALESELRRLAAVTRAVDVVTAALRGRGFVARL
jgi:hypothetical protein